MWGRDGIGIGELEQINDVVHDADRTRRLIGGSRCDSEDEGEIMNCDGA